MEIGLVVLWLAMMVGLTVVAAPLSALVFSPLSDRGGTLALPLALAVLGVTSYWVGQVAFGWPGIVATLLVLGGGSAYAFSRGIDPDWRQVGVGFAVFTIGFGLVVLIRNAQPAVVAGGGEKYLDFGLLKTLVRANSLPPEDFWYAGDRVQYYYGGHLVSAQLTTLTGIAARYSYNLSLATFYGALVTGAFGLAWNIAAERDLPRLAAGALAVFFVGFASNLTTLARTVVWLLPASMKTPVDTNPDRPGMESVEAFGATWSKFSLASGPDSFNYWPASRVIPGTINEFPLFSFLNGDLHAHMTSTHLLLLTAAVGLAYWLTPQGQVWRRRAYLFVCAPVLAGWLAIVNTWSYPSVAGITTLAVIFAGAHPASVFPARAWDRVEAAIDGSPAAAEATRLLAAGTVGVAVGVGGFLFAIPFFTGATSGQSLAFLPDRSGLAGLVLVHGAFLLVTLAYFAPRIAPGRRLDLGFGAPVALIALAAVGNALVGWVPIPTVVVALLGVAALTQLRDGDLVPGAVLYGLAVVLALATGPTVQRLGIYGATLLVGVGAVVSDLDEETRVVALTGVGFAVFAGVAWALDAVVLAVVTPALVLGWLLLRLDRDLGYETVLVVAAVGLVTMVEFVYVSERAGSGRFNTVFKFYMQVWILWGTAVGVMLTDVVARQWPDWSIGERLAAGRGPDLARLSRVAAVVFAAVLVLSTSIYGGLALSSHFDAHNANTLDAKQWTQDNYPDQYAAIEWLDEKEGRPVVVERPTTIHLYSVNRPTTPLVSGVSSLTGLPTIAGWGHASNYHTEEGWDERMADVAAVYEGESVYRETTVTRAAVLAKYDVQYIYVGPHEREHYDVSGLADAPGITVAKQFGDVTVYAVDQSGVSADASDEAAERAV
ncbi:DUF2298 domain-containing protein [Haloarchaeobius sp. HME9146]|uniref:DUF2298 domain-containing protein n=1 Tax=Haloarchaeobius sp. HME9146 TaxID=2978732 RepID=UPI0021C18C19|nr:DUF2298 domain-containing protein [Haloarchaeobius sp. HME9146]MCT9096109.1 DUF2298 domain-containing protein [Haloarchaeobius sp. HME9146]